MADTLSTIQSVMREVFEEDDLEVTLQTSARDIEAWDSLMHVTLLVRLERAFGIRFRVSDVAELENVADLCDTVDRLRA